LRAVGGCEAIGGSAFARTYLDLPILPFDRLPSEPSRAAELVVISRLNFSPLRMHLDKKFLQRVLLAFTTGLFLACAAQVSTASAAPAQSSMSATVR
jgi:hypothetical protein